MVPRPQRVQSAHHRPLGPGDILGLPGSQQRGDRFADALEDTGQEDDTESMDTFDHDLAQINERLVTDFIAQIPLTTLIAVLRACAAQNGAGSPPELIERAARTQLLARGVN